MSTHVAAVVLAGRPCSAVVLPAPAAGAPLRSSSSPAAAAQFRSRHYHRLTSSFFFFSPAAATNHRRPRVTPTRSAPYDVVVGTEAEAERRRSSSPLLPEREARIRKQLREPEELVVVSPPSPYDTAWVAMVPSPRSSPPAPCFPQCVEWILQNQHGDGSWPGFVDDASPPNTKKHLLLSTLACLVALRKWNVGPDHINRGLEFIGRNFSAVMDKEIAAPVGFHLTFPGMLSLAIGMDLKFPVRENTIDVLLQLYEMELKRLAREKSSGTEAYLAYVAEGAVNQLDWNVVKKYQRKNGSLFNSPSATASALIHNYDDKALQYINLLVGKFGNAVPTVYPQNIHCQLTMVDTLEKTGISRYFSTEIKSILDMVYSSWLEKDEEIMLDVETCAVAFRLLRMNGYDISSDELSHVAEASAFHNSLEGYLGDVKAILELYKASKVSLSENDLILEKIGSWSGSLLMEKLCSGEMQRRPIYEEVEYALKFPMYAKVEPLDHKWNIEHFDAKGSQMLKTKYLPRGVKQDLLDLAIENFRFSQSTYQDELQQMIRWEKENRLDKLGFVRQRLLYGYLAAATTVTPHELSDARVACAKSIVLTVVVDDFFDVGGSNEEVENLILLVEKWDEHRKDDFYSEKVETVFSALYTTVNQIGAMASAVQKRDVTKDLVDIWVQVIRSMRTEAEWQRRRYVPTVEEYMANAVVSIALASFLLPAQYLLGQTLTEHMIKHQGYNELSLLLFTSARLLNDSRSVERESREGKLNSVSLLVLHGGGSMSLEEAKEATHKSIVSCGRDLLRLVLRQDDVVPRSSKELFLSLCNTAHLFYFQIDGFTSPSEMLGAVNAVINEPLKL